MESSGMIPFLNIFLLTTAPLENFVSLNKYISDNAQALQLNYIIYEEVAGIIKKDKAEIIEKNQEAFFAYLDTMGIEHNNIGGYYFFNKK